MALIRGVLAAVVLAVVPLGGATPGIAAARQDAGAPFVTEARALARGDGAAACDQYSRAFFARLLPGHNLAAARRVCPTAVRLAHGKLDPTVLGALASTQVVRIRVNHGRARVSVQTTLYGVHPVATGTAVLEGGRWKILALPAGAHVGRSSVDRIPSESMLPTLHVGDWILVDPDAYVHSPPAIGDIVVLHPPVEAVSLAGCATRPPPGQACAAPGRRWAPVRFVKRIVARPGDRISLENGRLIRNGTPAAESYITPCDPQEPVCDFPRPLTVPAGDYYVLGDNRPASYDSRFWGPIPASAITGRASLLGGR
ncbi:MAG: signal peptidase I [Solirubrobacteraceae bacterium]